MRRAARTDANQAEIVKALRKVGCAVYVIGKPVDLLVCGGMPKRTVLIEVKTEEGTRTQEQKDFWDVWPGELHEARTPEDAIRAMLGAKAML